jgi:hypothetical protein
MPTNFHESYAPSELEPPSERSTGLTFAAIAVIFAVLWRNSPTVPWVGVGVGLGLTAVSLIAPAFLKPINILWFRAGLLLHRVVNPIVMFAVFVTVFVPAGVIMRLWRDPLRLKRNTSGALSYWNARGKSGDTEGSMANQF